MFKHILLTLTLLTTTAHSTPSPIADTSKVLPEGQSIAKVADNPYFQRGLQAAAQGLGAVSITIDTAPAASLAARINLVHLGMASAGFRLAGQSSIDANGNTALILLTYQR